jgi:hypothetical protein
MGFVIFVILTKVRIHSHCAGGGKGNGIPDQVGSAAWVGGWGEPASLPARTPIRP